MKGVEILKSRYKLILGYTGVILLGVSIAMLTPLLTIPFFSYKKLEIFAFIATAFFTAVIGFNLKRFVAKETNVTISIQEGGIVVLLSWITTLILSSLPFVISGQLNFVQAMFEVVSGYTTTGLSVVDVRETTHMVLLWRSVMQFLGGVGLVVIMLSAIIGPHGVGLYNAEARSDKLVPNIRKTTKMIMITSGIIISFTVEFPSNIPSKVVLNKIPPIFSSPPNFLTFKNDIVWGIFTTSFGFSIPINVAVPLKKSPSNVNPSLLCFPLILKYAIVNTTTHRPKTKAIMLEIIFVFGIISLPIL